MVRFGFGRIHCLTPLDGDAATLDGTLDQVAAPGTVASTIATSTEHWT